MRILLLLSAFLINGLLAHGQSHSLGGGEQIKHYEPFVIEFKWVVFVTIDSVYPCTQFIDQNGLYTFKLGFIDSASQLEDNTKSAFIKNDTSYVDTFKYEEGIDTIYSYLLPEELKGKIRCLTTEARKPVISTYKGVISLYRPIIEDLKYSYILKNLNLNSMETSNSSIRLLYPGQHKKEDLYYNAYDDERSAGIGYEVRTIKNYWIIELKMRKDTCKIYRVYGVSNDRHGLQVAVADSAVLKKKDYKHLEKALTKITPLSSQECRSPGEPWLLEYWNGADYARYIISDECLRAKRNLRSPAILYSLLKIFGRKYFD